MSTERKINKKYELTDETITYEGVVLHRIKALVTFRSVRAGDLGGFLEKESNLSHYGDAWVDSEARVLSNAQVKDNALVGGYSTVMGDAEIKDDAVVHCHAVVSGNTVVSGDAKIYV